MSSIQDRESIEAKEEVNIDEQKVKSQSVENLKRIKEEVEIDEPKLKWPRTENGEKDILVEINKDDEKIRLTASMTD